MVTTLYVNPRKEIGHIHPELQGHFSEHLGRCIYDGIYVGENSDIPNVKGMRTDVVEALKELSIPVLRWPGGCFADEYHWKDGIGPKELRKKMINTHWGGVIEDNSFGTDEFMELCSQLGCKNYINGNMGSGTVQEMSEWVEYMTLDGMSPMADARGQNGHEGPYRVDYFGVGNESWGCGGNMTPSFYANQYRRYQTFVRNYDGAHPIRKIACGPNSDDYRWTEEVLKTCFDYGGQYNHGFMDGLSLHYYTVPGEWEHKGSATDFDEKSWYMTLKKTLYMEELITRHSAIMDQYDPQKQVGLIVDEWGTWYDVEPGTNPGFLYQQNSVRDALVAGINLNIFNKHCERVRMANIAQLVNVLQSVILTEGGKMVLTPTYHVFHMYKNHQNNELVESYMDSPLVGLEEEYRVPHLTESVSKDAEGNLHVTLTNLSSTEMAEVDIRLTDFDISCANGSIVTGEMQEHNTFEKPDCVEEQDFEDYKLAIGGCKVRVPARSVVYLKLSC